MKQFEVRLEDKPGELAKLTSILSKVNIRSLNVDKSHDNYNTVRFMTVDNETTTNILNNNNYEFEENDVLLVGLLDRPGELAKLANKLGDSSINICALNLIDRSLFALQVSPGDLKKAKSLLKENLVEA